VDLPSIHGLVPPVGDAGMGTHVNDLSGQSKPNMSWSRTAADCSTLAQGCAVEQLHRKLTMLEIADA